TDEQSSPKPQWFTWERIRDALNLKDFPQLLRDDGFWAGLIVRFVTLIGFLLFINIAGDINDMNELVFKGMANTIQLINPYGQTYLLQTFGGPYSQNYFNYPPFAIIFHLPCMLWPGPQSIGTIDFMPAFFLLHSFFDFVTYYRLWQRDHRIISKILWINPFFIFVGIITFMSLPLMLLTLALLNLDKPMRSGLYSTLLAATYQMGAVFIPFLMVYHWRRGQLRQNILGMIPILLVVLVFFFWSPFLFVRDLFVMQVGRPPVNWQDNNPLSPYYNRYYQAAFIFMGSIPSIVFNIAILMGIPPPIAPQIAPIMMACLGVFGIIALIYFSKHTRKAIAIFLPGILLALFIASTAEGLNHYWVLCLTLPFLFWAQRDSFRASPVEEVSEEISEPPTRPSETYSNGEELLESQPSKETEPILTRASDAPTTLSMRIQVAIVDSFKLYRQWWKEIGLGIVLRVLALALILYVASVNPFFPDINDMNELLTSGLTYMFQGLNPYGRDYWLTALAQGPCDIYYQGFINYGPGSLLVHLPCMIYPYSINFAGCMDFQPSFMILHSFFDFLLFDRLMRRGHRIVALFVLYNPILVTLSFVTHLSVVIFILYMGYEKWKDPFWSAFWLGLGAITYQYLALLLLFAIAYHFRSYRKWLMGILPAVAIFGVFQLWASVEAILYNDPSRNLAMLNDLVFVQFGRFYEPWPLHWHSWWSWTGSVPAVLFNCIWIVDSWIKTSLGFIPIPPTMWVDIGDPLQAVTRGPLIQLTGGLITEGIRIATLFTVLAVLVTIYFLIKLLRTSDFKNSITYGVIAMGLFLVGAPAGIWHHNFIIVIPVYFLWVYRSVFPDRPITP
ncbi:MAG: hypothetical protein ACXADB_12775, partial [Candidatus Hermodarchaeia archaeon]